MARKKGGATGELATYRSMRDFGRTAEPAGRVRAKDGFGFVIQKHAASRLHYDFRLELDGVLKSWAVPKGPSLDPNERRLAVHVEDHPVEYGSFEGVIPKGQYGGGTVLLWDRGTWEPEGDPRAAYRKGSLTFRLHGEKLSGGWRLVRMGGRGKDDADNWLLIKRKDEAARGKGAPDVLEERPESVATGRSMERIASASDRVWNSRKPAAEAEERRGPAVDPSALPGARKARLPEWVEPQLATRVAAAPAGDAWLHEIKFDGYRAACRVKGGEARLLTRRGHDWSERFRAVAEAAGRLPLDAALLDGEVVAPGPTGKTSFQALQQSLSAGGQGLVYYAFDLLHLDGWDLAKVPLRERKVALEALLGGAGAGTIRYSDHVVGKGPAFHAQACAAKLEGTISKRADAPYAPGRGRDWVKTKCTHRQDFAIGGFSEPSGSREALGALHLGVWEDGEFRWVGKVGTGFTGRVLKDLRARLEPRARPTPPFVDPPRGAAARGVTWVEPELVAEVEFTEWTQDDKLRHPSFQGLREDIPASEVRRERTEVAPDGDDGETEATVAKGRKAAKKAPGKKKKAPAKKAPAKKAPAKKAPAKNAPAKARDGSETIGGVRVTHPERVLWSDTGVTKGRLAEHWLAVADLALRHVGGRPLTMVRCPRGPEGQCFYQKKPDDAFLPVIRRIDVSEADGDREPYAWVDSAAGLVALVQAGVVEVHAWTSQVDDLERPDRIVLDLDPDPDVGWAGVVAGARAVRERLAGLGLRPFVKTTGGKGVHVEAPIEPEHEWDTVKTFCRAIAEGFARENPKAYLATASKAKRKGKIFIDWLRNARGATAIVPYSPRRRPGAPVATPLAWEELARARPDRWRVDTIGRRLAKVDDPWAGWERARRPLTPAIEALVAPHRRP